MQITKARMQTCTHIAEALNLQNVFCCSKNATHYTFYSRMWLAIPGLLMSRAWILCAGKSRLPRAVSTKQTMQICYYHKFNPHPGPHHLHSFTATTQVSTAVSEKVKPCYLNGIHETHMVCSAIIKCNSWTYQQLMGLKKALVKKHCNSEMTRSSLFGGMMEHYMPEKRRPHTAAEA